MNLQDCKSVYLQGVLGKSGQINDLELEKLKAEGATANHIQEAWHQIWDADAIPVGQYNDRAYAWLASLGHTEEHINERWYGFW